MAMRAVVFDEYGVLPELRTVDEPNCPDGGVLIGVRATGVCRSDWHAWKGHDPVPLPHVPGHELAGVVETVGAGVTRWQPGDRVTVPFVCGCGACDYCRAGDAQVCPSQTQPGFTGPGSFADLVAIHAADTNLVRLPSSVDFVTAASLGCRFATAFRALTAHGRIAAGEWLAVHGCGGVGLSAVSVGVALGARVVAGDVSPAALDRARALGAEVVVDASVTAAADGAARGHEDGTAAAVRAVTDGGAHVSLDALGSPATAVASVRSLRRRGRHVQVGLLLADQSTPPLPMDLVVSQELSVHGSHGMPAVDYPAMLDLVADGTLRPDLLVGQVIGLAQAGEALASLDRPSATGGMTVVEIS